MSVGFEDRVRAEYEEVQRRITALRNAMGYDDTVVDDTAAEHDELVELWSDASTAAYELAGACEDLSKACMRICREHEDRAEDLEEGMA